MHAQHHCCPRVLLQSKDLKQLSKKIRDVRNPDIMFSLECWCFLSQILILQYLGCGLEAEEEAVLCSSACASSSVTTLSEGLI